MIDRGSADMTVLVCLKVEFLGEGFEAGFEVFYACVRTKACSSSRVSGDFLGCCGGPFVLTKEQWYFA